MGVKMKMDRRKMDGPQDWSNTDTYFIIIYEEDCKGKEERCYWRYRWTSRTEAG